MKKIINFLFRLLAILCLTGACSGVALIIGKIWKEISLL
jgi:hypothetical protein